MKAEELMVGDYVRDKKTKDIIWIFEIDADRKVINNEPDGYCSERNILIDDIESIPLTAEILAKNGIKKNSYGDHIIGKIYSEDGHREIQISTTDTDIWWSINLEEYPVLKLNFVHELQHALRLCGIEKEIIL